MYPHGSPIHSDTNGCVGAVDVQRCFRADADARPAVMRCDKVAQADELSSRCARGCIGELRLE
jgi:hypothetical protein